MSERMLVSVFGAVIEIDASALGAEVREHVGAAWSSARTSSFHEPDGIVQARWAGGARETLSNLAADIVAAARGGSIGNLWMLRARALINAEGQVVVLCGASAPRELVASGAMTVAEGILGIDASGTVIPIPMPSSAAVAGDRVSLPPAVLRLVRIVFLDCIDDAPETAEVDTLELGETLSLLFAESEQLCESRAPLRSIVALLSGTGGAVRIRHRAGTCLEPIITDLLEPAFSEIVVPARRSAGKPPRRAIVDEGRIYRGEAADSCLLPDGRLALLKSETAGNGRLKLLDALESAVWLSADGVDLDDIVETALRVQGQPSDAGAAQKVASVVVELTTEGWLSGEPAWHVNEDTAWVSSDSRATVLNVAAPNQPPLSLEGSAHVVWDVVCRSQSKSQGAIIDETAAYFGAESREVAEGVVNLLHDLESYGALSQV